MTFTIHRPAPKRAILWTPLAVLSVVAAVVGVIINCWPLERLLAWLSNPHSECRR